MIRKDHEDSTLNSDSSTSSSIGRTLALIFGGSVFVGSLFIAPFLLVPYLPRRLYGALPYYPTSPRRIKAVFDSLPKRYSQHGASFIDLGSGDGVAVLEAARRGLYARGIELNPTLVIISRLRAFMNTRIFQQSRGVCEFSTGNLFDFNISGKDASSPSVVMIFGVVPIMKKVGEKIVKEAPEDVIVLSHKFPIPEETGLQQIAIIDDIHLYIFMPEILDQKKSSER